MLKNIEARGYRGLDSVRCSVFSVRNIQKKFPNRTSTLVSIISYLTRKSREINPFMLYGESFEELYCTS